MRKMMKNETFILFDIIGMVMDEKIRLLWKVMILAMKEKNWKETKTMHDCTNQSIC